MTKNKKRKTGACVHFWVWQGKRRPAPEETSEPRACLSPSAGANNCGPFCARKLRTIPTGRKARHVAAQKYLLARCSGAWGKLQRGEPVRGLGRQKVRPTKCRKPRARQHRFDCDALPHAQCKQEAGIQKLGQMKCSAWAPPPFSAGRKFFDGQRALHTGDPPKFQACGEIESRVCVAWCFPPDRT